MKQTKNMKKGLSLFYILFIGFLLINIPFINSVKADLGDLMLADWDDVANGTQDGTSILIDFEQETSYTTEYWTVTNSWCWSSSNSFFIEQDNNPVRYPSGWWNFTDDFDYINGFDFYAKMNQASGNFHFYFKKSGVTVLHFNISTGEDINVYESDGSWNDVSASIEAQEDHIAFIKVRCNETNNLWFRLYNITGVLKSSKSCTSSIADDWDTFDQIYIDCTSTGVDAQLWIDDFSINTNEQQIAETDITAVDVGNGCNDVMQGTVKEYRFNVYGETGGGIVNIHDSNDDLFFSKVITIGQVAFNVYYPETRPTGTYTLTITSFLYLITSGSSGFQDNCTFEVYSVANTTAYTDEYGDFFIEWYTGEYIDPIDCYWNETSTPAIIYKLNDTFDTEDIGYYTMDIVRNPLHQNTLEYSMKIRESQWDSVKIDNLSSYHFAYAGQYQIVLYNMTNAGDGSADARNEVIYQSLPIEVCYSRGEVEPEPPDVLPDLGEGWGGILGIFVVAFFGLMPLVLQTMAGHSGMTIKIPLPTYSLFGVLGAITSFYFGFFPLWVLFFILAMSLVLLGFVYLVPRLGSGD